MGRKRVCFARIEHEDIAAALAWPPTDAAMMQAWQDAFGTDAAIACRLGCSRATVANHRRRLGVVALRPENDRRVRERRPKARLTGAARIGLYRDRRYEDVALRRRPDNVVAGIGWVL